MAYQFFWAFRNFQSESSLFFFQLKIFSLYFRGFFSLYRDFFHYKLKEFNKFQVKKFIRVFYLITTSLTYGISKRSAQFPFQRDLILFYLEFNILPIFHYTCKFKSYFNVCKLHESSCISNKNCEF